MLKALNSNLVQSLESTLKKVVIVIVVIIQFKLGPLLQLELERQYQWHLHQLLTPMMVSAEVVTTTTTLQQQLAVAVVN